MRLSDRLKHYLPITFAIIVICLCLTLGILNILGVSPFKRNKDIGIGLIVYAVFGAFYTGLCIGHLIAFLVKKCIPDTQNHLNIQINSV